MSDAVTLSCTYCGEEYTRHPSNAMKSRFCSSDCQQKHKHEHPEEYSRDKRTEVHEIRDSIFERDGEVCVQCGKVRTDGVLDLEMHHVIPSKYFKDHTESYFEENLVTLCTICHPGWDRVTRQTVEGEDVTEKKYQKGVLAWLAEASTFSHLDEGQLERELKDLREKVDEE